MRVLESIIVMGSHQNKTVSVRAQKSEGFCYVCKDRINPSALCHVSSYSR